MEGECSTLDNSCVTRARGRMHTSPPCVTQLKPDKPKILIIEYRTGEENPPQLLKKAMFGGDKTSSTYYPALLYTSYDGE